MKRRGLGSLTRLHPGAHPLIIYASSFTFLFFFWFPTFFVPLSHFFSGAISPLRHLSPLRVPCNATDGLCERWGRSQRISLYLTPACPSSSSHSLIYHTQVLLIVVWQPAPGPGLVSSLSELLSSLPWASAGNKSASWICISSDSHHCKVHSTSKHVVFWVFWGVFLFFFSRNCVIMMLLDHLQFVYSECVIIN